MEVPEDELLEGACTTFLPFSTIDGEGITGIVYAAVDGGERVLAVGDVVMLNDVLIRPVVVVDRGTKKLLKLLLFFRSTSPAILFLQA